MTWKLLPWEQCPTCVNDVEINTDSDADDRFYADERVRCVDAGCGQTGISDVCDMERGPDGLPVLYVMWSDLQRSGTTDN